MKLKDGLSAAASLCAVLAFLAGTAASTVNAGLVYAGLAVGVFLLLALADSAKEAKRGDRVTTEVFRSQSSGELWLFAFAVACATLGMVLDAIEREEAWNQSFGIAQGLALLLIAGGAYVAWGEWRFWRSYGRKQCPKCAEEVRREAQVCKHCGHHFEGVQTPSA